MNRKPNRRGVFWAGIALFLIIIIAAGVWLAAGRAPALADQVPYNRPELSVSLLAPQDGSSWPADAFIPVDVELAGTLQAERVELWANSRLVAVQPAAKSSGRVRLSFQPGTPGKVLLTAVGVSAGGANATSGVILLDVSAPAGMVEVQPAKAGDTLEGIALRVKLPLERLKAANPTLDPLVSLPVNTQVSIPHDLLGPNGTQSPEPDGGLAHLTPLPADQVALPDLPGQPGDMPGQPIEIKDPVELQKIIAGLGGEAPVSSQPEPLVTGPLQNLWGQLQGLITANPAKPGGTPAGLPGAPYFWMYSASYDGAAKTCKAYLNFLDQSDNEDGFFIYRAPVEGGEFERIATLEPSHASKGMSVVYYDTTGYGDMTYIAAAFNAAGENRSKPISLEFDARCPAPAGSGGLQVVGNISVHDGLLQVPLATDLAYLYVKIANLPWERIPEQGKFLPGTGNFDLSGYLESRLDLFSAVDFEVTYEVWGWLQNKAQKLGSIHQTIHRSVLLVCSKAPGQCSGSGPGSGWVSDLTLPDDIPLSPELQLEFMWDTGNTKKLTGGKVFLEGISGQFGSLAGQPSLISAWTTNWKGPADQRFSSSPGRMHYDPKSPVSLGKWDYGGYSYDSNFFMKDAAPGSPFILQFYVHLKTSNNSELPRTNTVHIRYRNQKPAPPAVTLAPEIPSLYELKFLQYTPPLLPRGEDWGCVIILNDTSWFKAGQRICPSTYVPPSDWEVLVDGIGGMIESGYNWLANAIADAKNWVVDQVADVLGCTGVCRDLLMAGLNYGITALTGLPPSLPNFDQIAAQGIEYAVQITAEEMGVTYCPDEVCREAIRKGLQTAVDQARSQASPPGCVGDAEAHARGKNPLCLPAGVAWRPAIHSVYVPPTIQLQITRKPGSAGGLTQADARKYAVQISVPGSNSSRIGDWFPICGFNENPQGPETGYTDSGGGYKLKRQINEPLQGDLYASQVLEVPWLQPGQSISVPVPLNRARYLRPNHPYDWNNADLGVDEAIQNCGDDWPYLYFDGVSLFKAEEICLNPQGQRVACGAKTEFKIDNPPSNTTDIEPPVAVPASP